MNASKLISRSKSSFAICLLLMGMVAVLTTRLPRAEASKPPAATTGTNAARLYVLDTEDGRSNSRVLVVDTSEGTVQKTYKAGYYPDMALAPDGARLYIASSIWTPNKQSARASEPEGRLKGFLEIYDTASSAMVARVDNPDAIGRTLPVYPTSMTMSPSGNWLYVLRNVNWLDSSHPNSAAHLYLAAFDVQRRQFLPDRVPVPECGAILLPTSRDLTVDLKCADTDDVMEITFGGSRYPNSVTIPLGVNVKKWGAAFLESDERAMGLIASDGSAFLFDRLGHTVQPLGTTIKSGALRPMERALVSAGRDVAYFGANGSRNPGWEDRFDQVVMADATTLAPKASLWTTMPFFSMALSADGERLYAVNPERSAITVIDTEKLQEVRRLRVGETPIFAIAAP